MARERQGRPGRTLDEALTGELDFVVAVNRKSAIRLTEPTREAVSITEVSRRAFTVTWNGDASMRWTFNDADQAKAAARFVAVQAVRGDFDEATRR